MGYSGEPTDLWYNMSTATTKGCGIMTAVRTSGNVKLSRKLVYASLALLFALAVVVCIMAYVFIAFPLDVDEEQCGMLTNETTRIILCRRSGGATVAFHYVLYENEIDPDNVVAVIRDTGTMPNLESVGKGRIMVHISDTNDIVYLAESALVNDLNSTVASIKFIVKE